MEKGITLTEDTQIIVVRYRDVISYVKWYHVFPMLNDTTCVDTTLAGTSAWRNRTK